MKRKIFWLSVFIFFSSFLPAEDTVKELEKKLKNAVGEERVGVLNTLSGLYLPESPQKAIETAEQAAALSKKLDLPVGAAAAGAQRGHSGHRRRITRAFTGKRGRPRFLEKNAGACLARECT